MPTVPVSNPDPIQQQVLPSARLTAAPSGDSPIGQGLQSLGQQGQQVFIQQRRKAQDAMEQDANTQQDQADLDQEYDPKTGWRTQKGSNAFGLHETALPAYDKNVDRIASNIPDPEVRDKFLRNARANRVHVQGRLDSWIDQQHHQYAGQVLEEGIKTSQAAAALNWHDPARVQSELAKQTERLRGYAADNGLPPEWSQSKIQDAASTTHGAVIQQMMSNGQDLAAKRYFDDNKGELTAEAQVSLGRAVDYGSSQQAAQAAAAGIYAPGKSLEEMEGQADEIKDQRIQAETKQRLGQLHALHQQAVAEEGRNLLRDGMKVLNADPRGLDAVPAQTLSRLNEVYPEGLQALREQYARMIRKEDVTTPQGNALFIRNRSALSGVYGEAARDAATKQDMGVLAPLLSKADFREITDLQDRARTGKDTTAESTEEHVAAQVLALNKFDPRPIMPDGKTPNVEAIAFRSAFRRQIQADKAAGKKLNGEDLTRTANRLMAPQTNGQPLFMLGVDAAKPETVTSASGAYALSLGDFDDATIKSAGDKLRGAGAAATDDAILRYLRAQAAEGTLRAAPLRPSSQGPVMLGGVDVDSSRDGVQ